MNENGEKINFENLKFLSGRNTEKEKSNVRSEKEIRSLEEISIYSYLLKSFIFITNNFKNGNRMAQIYIKQISRVPTFFL